MTIAAILEGKPSDIVSVGADTPLRDAVSLLAEKKIGALPVLDGERVVGIISERDVIYCLSSDGAAMLDWPVSRVMTAPAITIEFEFGGARRLVADDPAADSPPSGGRGRTPGRIRLDRRSRRLQDQPDRAGGRGDAGLYPECVTLF